MYDREVICVLGKTGHGKSVWTRKYLEGVQRLFVLDPLASIRAEYLTAEDLIQRYDDGNFASGNFRVATHDPSIVECIGSLAFLVGHCTLVIEEAGVLFAKGARMDDWLRDIVFLGRHKRVSLLVTAQRSISIPIDLRSQVTRTVTFAQSEGDDVAWLRTYLGENLGELPFLKPLECFDATAFGVDRYKISFA